MSTILPTFRAKAFARLIVTTPFAERLPHVMSGTSGFESAPFRSKFSVQTPPLWQIGVSVSLLLLTIWAVAWFAGRVYRVGILMYGKKPTLPEIFRWAFQTD